MVEDRGADPPRRTEVEAVTSGDETLLRLEPGDGGVLRIVVHGEEVAIPMVGVVRVILDGPVLEICSGTGLFGAKVSPRGDSLVVTTGPAARIAVHALTR